MSNALHEDALYKAAISALEQAYAPYSGFQVGAAVLDEHGQIHSGGNVENAAYPNGICAETSAIAAMVASGGRQIKAIAVAGRGAALCTPCGGCRQRIREFAEAGTPIHICDETGHRASYRLDALLPMSFGPDNLTN